MVRSRLILMEGLPSTGKSTNSGILLSQLERNGHRAKWVHEVARPHPTLFFYEACMEEHEYKDFITRYPHSVSILEPISMRRNNSIGIDLLEVEWNHSNQLGEDAYQQLKKYDVWNFTVDRYMKVALEKWEHFVNKQNYSDEIVILDSSLFQYQIYSLILADVPFTQLMAFIEAIYRIISPLHPSLIYLYREKTDDTINYLVRERGVTFLERIWNRDKERPYYKGRPAGAEGYKMFLRDYGEYAKLLFDSAPLPKLSVEITQGKWGEYVDLLLNFMDLSYIDPPKVVFPSGTYFNVELNQHIEIVGKYIVTPDGGRKHLEPKSDTEYYLHDLPVVIRLDENGIIIEGEQICDKWTTKGTVFQKVADGGQLLQHLKK
ncbi:hypothetical protein Back11_57590 [Paenibacillus baekrokdamisoli]|uniref:Uncharacterized protein n=1 Tax=Paenibacillus baekrokdamisoli TaxID=1712516 RepID=A0A3G9JNH5_9BACL|nr:hypothetical protein [Paenibacillus baekrokdamisoli]MBB3072856.1 hypothetical protein [Paenibacillus baekrokdamisoli]BBH24414.1 hypothetical protein Back11_57590 [Paenibacillus baekrokdamisoli]